MLNTHHTEIFKINCGSNYRSTHTKCERAMEFAVNL